MEIDQINQIVAEMHFEVFMQARRQGKEMNDALLVANHQIHGFKSGLAESIDAGELAILSDPLTYFYKLPFVANKSFRQLR